MNAVQFDNVIFSYSQGETEVLSDTSFEIERGKFIALLGANGSGKSTIAKLINRLLEKSSGKIVVLGYDADDEANLFEIRRRAGMVFQNPDNQQIASIVEDDVAFGPENIGLERDEIGRRIDYALKVTDMEKFRFCQSANLSGGQKQRIAIAGVLAIGPEILILDESTSMLDPKGRKEVIEVAKTLNIEHGMTVIDITHYMDEAVLADQIYLLKSGQIIAKGQPSQIFSQKALISSCGLELPRPAILAQMLNEKGVPVGEGILTKEELSERLCELLQTK